MVNELGQSLERLQGAVVIVVVVLMLDALAIVMAGALRGRGAGVAGGSRLQRVRSALGDAVVMNGAAWLALLVGAGCLGEVVRRVFRWLAGDPVREAAGSIKYADELRLAHVLVLVCFFACVKVVCGVVLTRARTSSRCVALSLAISAFAGLVSVWLLGRL